VVAPAEPPSGLCFIGASLTPSSALLVVLRGAIPVNVSGAFPVNRSYFLPILAYSLLIAFNSEGEASSDSVYKVINYPITVSISSCFPNLASAPDAPPSRAYSSAVFPAPPYATLASNMRPSPALSNAFSNSYFNTPAPCATSGIVDSLSKCSI